MEEALKLNFTIFGLDEKGTMTVLMIILDMLIVAFIVGLGRSERKEGPQGRRTWSNGP